ncbi:MAG: CbtB-domain containing protein [Hyphomicrobiaceae bacterium]|nr:CbtB-domain containing protein [Hyphomicrobiaceae bacterium]
MQLNAKTAEAHSLTSSTGLSRLSQVALAMLFGMTMLYVAGFMPSAHEAAHDTRHAIGFPCH